MSTLVIGAMDVVGNHVVRALVARGERVLALSRSTFETDSLPDEVEGVLGDLSDLISLRIIFEGIDNVVLIPPLVPDQARLGVNAVVAARAASVEKLVYLSHYKLEDFPDVLHFANSMIIERTIRESRIAWTVLRASNLFQNDALYREDILHGGIYPQPIGNVGVCRVDARDVALAIVNCLNKGEHNGQTYPIVGAEAQTGEGVAATYSSLLGHPIRYGGDDAEAWGERMRGRLSSWLIRDCQTMWSEFQDRGLLATSEDMALCRFVLGRAPLGFDAYAAELLGPDAYRPTEISASSQTT